MAEKKTVELNVETNLKSLKTQLREAQNEVNSLSEKFGATSKEAIQAAKSASILKDKIADSKALTDAFNPDAKFKSLTASLSGAAGGFTAFQGAMGLVGAESKNIEATLLKVQSAMALSQGLQQLGEARDSFKQLGAVVKSTTLFQALYTFVQTGSFTAITATTTAQAAETVATVAQGTALVGTTVATTGATGALKIFRLALLATGIGAIVIAIGLLIANFSTIMNMFTGNEDANKRNAAAVKANTQEIERNIKANNARAESLQKSLSYEYDMAKANGATNEQLREMAVRHAQSTIEMEKNSVAIATQIYWKNKLKLQQLINADADEEDIKNQRNNAVEAHKALEKEQNDYHKALENKKDVFKKNNIEIATERTAANKQDIEDEKARVAELKKINDAAIEKKLAAVDAAIKKKKEDERAEALDFELSDIEEAKQKELDDKEQARLDAIALRKRKDKEEETVFLLGIDEYLAKQKSDADEAEKKRVEKQYNDRINNLQSFQNTTADLIYLFQGKSLESQKKAFKLQKAVNMASTLVETFLGAQKAFTSQIIPGDPTSVARGAIASAGVTISGLANVKRIAATTFEGGGGGGGGGTPGAGDGGGTSPSGTIASPITPTFNIVGANGQNQLNGLNQPIQAFVVSGQVTTQQQLDRNKLRNATF